MDMLAARDGEGAGAGAESAWSLWAAERMLLGCSAAEVVGLLSIPGEVGA